MNPSAWMIKSCIAAGAKPVSDSKTVSRKMLRAMFIRLLRNAGRGTPQQEQLPPLAVTVMNCPDPCNKGASPKQLP